MLLTRRFLQNLILALGVTATLIFDVEIRFSILLSQPTFYVQNISVLPGQVGVLRVGGPTGQVEAVILPAGAVPAPQHVMVMSLCHYNQLKLCYDKLWKS